jgi:hypothetical protein
MPDYRRYRVPGGTYFFTINLLERRADLLVRHIEPLRVARGVLDGPRPPGRPPDERHTGNVTPGCLGDVEAQ